LTDEEKVERYNERIRLQMIQNKKWVENNKQKYQELMASYSRNYYQKNKVALNKKRTEYNRKKKELASKTSPVALPPSKLVVKEALCPLAKTDQVPPPKSQPKI